MLIKALLVALVYYGCCTIQWFGIFHFNRPIIVGTLIGIVLGDVRTGVIMGCTFESVFLGVIAVGGSTPADATIGATFGTAFAILSGLNYEAALALSTPVAMAGLMLMAVPVNLIFPLLVPKAQKQLEMGNTKKFDRYQVLMGLLMYAFQAIVVFTAVYLGTDAINIMFSTASGLFAGTLGKAAEILPSIGMALLLNTLYDKKIGSSSISVGI